jgi:hypothetical protein
MIPMGNSSRPGSVVVREIDHEPFEVRGVQYLVRELIWNDIAGRSYELVRVTDDVVLTEDESFDEYLTDPQVAAVLADHGIDVELETCTFCHGEILRATAHLHGNAWVGDSCCWDERLRATQ